MSENFNVNLNGESKWNYLWIVPMVIVMGSLGLLLGFSVILIFLVGFNLLGAMLVALPVWLIWGAIFPALMGYCEWVGIIVVIRLIFSPIFTRGINKYLTNKYQK